MDMHLLPLKSLSVQPNMIFFKRERKRPNMSLLAKSIVNDGLLYPLVVKKIHDRYIVLDGKKRLYILNQLSKLKNFTRSLYKIPCIIQPENKAQDISRDKPMLLSEPELANEIITAAQQNISHVSIAQRFECKLSIVKDCLSLQKLSPELLMHFNNQVINLQQAAAFATIENKDSQLLLLKLLGPFVSNVEIIKAIKDGKTVIEISEDNIIFLPSRGAPLSEREDDKTEFGKAGMNDTRPDRIAA